jgi:hypothetical protein
LSSFRTLVPLFPNPSPFALGDQLGILPLHIQQGRLERINLGGSSSTFVPSDHVLDFDLPGQFVDLELELGVAIVQPIHLGVRTMMIRVDGGWILLRIIQRVVGGSCQWVGE